MYRKIIYTLPTSLVPGTAAAAAAISISTASNFQAKMVLQFLFSVSSLKLMSLVIVSE